MPPQNSTLSSNSPGAAAGGATPPLPGYASLLAAQHRAHEEELRELIRSLPVQAGGRVVDAPCGDGFYARLLASRCGRRGLVVAADASLAFLKAARSPASPPRSRLGLTCLNADVYRLPLQSDSFDLAWCAQSFLTLAGPVDALRELKRVIRPAGSVAVLEQDRLHWMILPWPPEIEIAVHRAERALLEAEHRDVEKLYTGRHLRHLLNEAGFHSEERTTWTVDRQYPLPSRDVRFLEEYFHDLWNRIHPYLPPKSARQLSPLITPQSTAYLPRQQDFEMTCNYIVSVGKK